MIFSYRLAATCVAAMSLVDLAHAGTPTPAPLAGAGGPLGLVALGIGYLGYRIYKQTKR